MEGNILLNAIHQALSMNDLSLAEEYALQLKEEQKESAPVFLLLGTIYTRKREYIKAIDILSKANYLDPENADILNNLAIVYKWSGDRTGALETIKKAYDLEPGKADICYNIANLYKESGNYDRAITFYKKTLDIDPRQPFVYNNLGNLYEEKGDISRALSQYKEGLLVDPNHPGLHYNLGILYLARGEKEKAVIEFKRSVKSKPGWVEGLNNLGAALLDLGKVEEAYHTFMNAYRVNTDSDQTLNNLGLALIKLGRFEEAKGYLKKAIRINPNHIDAVINLGKVQDKSGSETGAIDLLKSLLTRKNNSIEIRLLLSKLLLQKERFTEASDTIRNVLRRDSKSSEGHTLLGILNIKTGKKKRALARFTKALELSPSNLEARYQRALLLYQNGTPDQSVSDLEYILAANPDFYQTRLLLADAYLDSNRYEEALELYRELKEQYPGDERILHQVVFLLKQTGNKEEALQTAEELIALQGKDESPETANNMERTLSLYEEIINDFEKDYDSLIRRNIAHYLTELDHLSVNKEKPDEELLLLDPLPDLDKEIVPIIDFGGIEPIITVNEEDREILNLAEMEEIINLPDEKEDIETIRQALLRGENSGNQASSSNYSEQKKNPSPQSMQQPSAPNQQPYQTPVQPVMQPVQIIPVPQVIITQPAAGSSSSQMIVHSDRRHSDRRHSEKGVPVKMQKSEPRERRKNDEFQIESADTAGLLNYLENLTDYLPGEKKRNFKESDMMLKIETLKAKMSGKPGLEQIIEKKYLKGDTVEEMKSISKDKVESTFKFINTLTDYLPDKSVSTTIKNKIDNILSMMKDAHGKGKTT